MTLLRTQPSRQEMVRARGGDTAWGIAEECPVEIGFNGAAWTVMMASPSDIADLALGLALTEGALRDVTSVTDIAVREWPEGITADIRVDPAALVTERITRRTLDGRTGCGLCGVETLAEIHRPTGALDDRPAIDDRAIRAALDGFADQQPLNQTTRSVHAAAWCDLEGNILTVREDVGRHNALDKLVGARLTAPEAGFVLMSSRCSFELVFKAARLQAGCLATLSAPTGLALDMARALKLPLACRGPAGEIIRFNEDLEHG